MKLLGVIGGMGSVATLDFFGKVLCFSGATSDQESPHIIIDNNSKIPDRTSFILSGGIDPRPALQESARKLVDFGAQILVMPCNTAHYFYSDIVNSLRGHFGPCDFHFINMIDETVKVISAQGVKRVVLLATLGTLRTGLYQKAFSLAGIDTVEVCEADQLRIMKLIYQYKSGLREFDGEYLSRLILSYDGLPVLGCTELPLIFERVKLLDRVINPTEILAKKAIEKINEKGSD